MFIFFCYVGVVVSLFRSGVLDLARFMTDGTLNSTDGSEDNLLISPAWSLNNGSQSGDLGCKTVYYIIHLGHVFGKILSLVCHHVLYLVQCLGDQPKWEAGVTA